MVLIYSAIIEAIAGGYAKMQLVNCHYYLLPLENGGARTQLTIHRLKLILLPTLKMIIFSANVNGQMSQSVLIYSIN